MTQRTKMILGVAGFAALLVCAVLAYNALSKRVEPPVNQQQTQAQQQTAPRDAAPDFTVIDEDGNAVRLSDMRGKPVVLNFWASWCPPCRQEMPEFDAAHKEMGGGVVFMMVNCGDTVETGAWFVREQGYGFPVYFDTKGEAGNAYGVSGIPATFFIDSEGAVASSQVGALSGAALRAGIERILP